MIKSPHPAVDLSFMFYKGNGKGIDYWDVTTFGDYSADYERGEKLAREYLAYLGQHPTNGNSTLLGCIVQDMGAGKNGVMLGFLRGVNSYAMAAACMLRGSGTNTPANLASDALEAAEAAYRPHATTDDDELHNSLFEAKERALEAFERAPCLTLEDVRRKVRIALKDENVFDALKSCVDADGEPCLRAFLLSLLGEGE